MMKGWKVGWFELLADGKLSWFPSPSKVPSESRYTTSLNLQLSVTDQQAITVYMMTAACHSAHQHHLSCSMDFEEPSTKEHVGVISC